MLMIDYTNYRIGPRVIRAAEAAASAGFNVDFIALRRANDPPEESMRYRGGGVFWYMLSYLEFFVQCIFKTTSLQFGKRYAAVHVNNIPDFLVFSALLPKLMGVKVLLDIHDPMPNTFASKFESGQNSVNRRPIGIQNWV